MYSRLRDFRGDPIGTMIVRDAEGAHIPADPRNADWQAYQAWLAAGNAPAEPASTAAAPGAASTKA